MTSGQDLITTAQNVDVVRSEIQNAMQDKYSQLAAFTDGKVWNKKRYIDMARESLQLHVVSGIQAGKALIVLKEMCAVGEFGEAIEEVGINKMQASRLMRVAFRFSGFDKETAEALGMTKLYTMLQAPVEETEKLLTDGKFLDMEKDDLIRLSTRELNARIKEAVSKAKLDYEQERLKSDKLHEEKLALLEDKRKLQEELVKVKAGAPPEEKLPVYWNEYSAVLAALDAFSHKLSEHPNDFTDEQVARVCESMFKRIEHAWAHCRKFLCNHEVDPVELQERVQEKISMLRNDRRFDLSKIED